MLAEYLLELKDTGVLRANHVCILHYWSHYAGAAGPVERLKVLPDSVSGNFHKHLDKVRDTTKDNGPFYNLKIATFSSKDGRRIEATAPAVPLKNDMNSMQDPLTASCNICAGRIRFRLLITIMKAFLQIPLQTCTPWCSIWTACP